MEQTRAVKAQPAAARTQTHNAEDEGSRTNKLLSAS